MFGTGTFIETPSEPEHIVINLLAVNQTVAFKPACRPPAVATGNGAGPSRPSNPVDGNQYYISKVETAKQLKIAGIRASLQYNGYPPDVIEDLIQNSLSLYPQKYRHFCVWALILPNGETVTTYGEIDANPYPGGKVVVNRICHTVGCGGKFGHKGGCRVSHLRRVKRKAAPMAQFSPAKRQARTVPPLPSQSSQSILSSSSDDEQEIEERGKGEEQEQPREEESPIYLLTTEDEEDSDFQGEDEYSSLYD